MKLGSDLGLEHTLGQPVTVAHVDEDEPSKVAPGVDPAVERDGLSHMVECQITASMCPFEHGRRVFGRLVRSDSSVIFIGVSE